MIGKTYKMIKVVKITHTLENEKIFFSNLNFMRSSLFGLFHAKKVLK